MPTLPPRPARVAPSAALLVLVACAAACSSSSSTSGADLDLASDGGANGPGSDAAGSDAASGATNGANDPCITNAWAMPMGCRGGEARTHVLAPKHPKVAWTTDLPGSIVIGGVVDDAGRIYVVLGNLDGGVSAPAGAIYRADPASKRATLFHELVTAPDSHSGLAIDSGGSILVVDGGKALALDPSDGTTRWELAVGADGFTDEPGAVVVEADGGMHAFTGRDYKVFDAAGKVRWTKPTSEAGTVYERPVIDADGRSFALVGYSMATGYVGSDRDGVELFSGLLNSDPGGWTATATDGQLFYGFRNKTERPSYSWLGAIDNAKGRLDWEEPMESVVGWGEIGITVLGPASVVFRTSTQLLAKRDGKTAWTVELDADDPLFSTPHTHVFSDREQTVVVDTPTGLAGYDKSGKQTFAADTGEVDDVYPARDGAVWTVGGVNGKRELSFVSDD